jgi:hypothetical protein
MGFDKSLLIESLQNRLQNEVFSLTCHPYWGYHHKVFFSLLSCHDIFHLYRRQLYITYSWTISFVQVQTVVILELTFKNLW